jgi:hypothetical protein
VENERGDEVNGFTELQKVFLAATDFHRKECLRHKVAQKIGRTFPPSNHADWEQFHRAIWHACENAAKRVESERGDEVKDETSVEIQETRYMAVLPETTATWKCGQVPQGLQG